MKKFFVMIVMMLVGFTGVMQAQISLPRPPSVNGGGCCNQNFALSVDLARDMNMTKGQIDDIGRQLVLLNYDFNVAASDVASLDQQIRDTENDGRQSPQAISNTVGNLVVLQVIIRRRINAEVITVHDSLLRVLTPQQQFQLIALQNNIAGANSILNLSENAYGANLMYRPGNSGGDAKGLAYTGGVDDMFAATVSRIKADRARQAEEQFRKEKFIQPEAEQ